MKKKRSNDKSLVLLALIIAVVGLGIGFSFFTKTLNIKSSATVNPTDTFKIVFSTSGTESLAGSPVYDLDGYASGGTFAKDATSLTDLTANFTDKNQTATWELYAFNDSEYDGYLNNVEIGNITCTANDGTTQSLVDEACHDLSIKVTVGDTDFTQTTASNLITTHKLESNKGEKVKVSLTYAGDNKKADGSFSVDIGKITLTYDSVDKD